MDRSRLFREAAERHDRDRGRTGWRYPPEVRRLAVKHCREQREAGRPYSEIAEDLGVTAASLTRWLEESPPDSNLFLPVEVYEPTPSSEPASRGLSAETPGGLRIEGLAWSQVLEPARVFG